MGVPYPKTFTKGQTSPPIAANDNRPGRVYLPANDNRRIGRSMLPQIARGLRKMPIRAWQIEAALSLVEQLASRPGFGDAPTPWEPGPEGLDLTGWDTLENFGRPEHFNVPGTAGNGWTWPNVTQATHYSYPGALVGYTGTPGFYDYGYVTEFQTAADPNASEFSTWAHYDFDGPATSGELENVAGWDYWRVGSAKTYGRQAGNLKPVPQVAPLWWYPPRPATEPAPMSQVRLYSKWQVDPLGNPLRGPAPVSRTRTAPLPKRPDKHTKERKFALTVSGIGRLILGSVTEGFDTVSAIFDALPLALRQKLWAQNGGYLSPIDKALAIYRYFDQVDMAKAVQNLTYEQLEDYVYGRIGQITAKANRRRGMPGGAELGPALEGIRVTIRG